MLGRIKWLTSLSFAAIALSAVLNTSGRSIAAPMQAGTKPPKSYDTKCVRCHGADGKGKAGLDTPDFTDAKWQQSRTDKDLTDSITNGNGIMPPYGQSLSKAEIADLVAYVRSFAKSEK